VVDAKGMPPGEGGRQGRQGDKGGWLTLSRIWNEGEAKAGRGKRKPSSCIWERGPAEMCSTLCLESRGGVFI
jgi:hypothetical protein